MIIVLISMGNFKLSAERAWSIKWHTEGTWKMPPQTTFLNMTLMTWEGDFVGSWFEWGAFLELRHWFHFIKQCDPSKLLNISGLVLRDSSLTQLGMRAWGSTWQVCHSSKSQWSALTYQTWCSKCRWGQKRQIVPAPRPHLLELGVHTVRQHYRSYSQLPLQLSPEKAWQYKSLLQVFCPLALSTAPQNTRNCPHCIGEQSKASNGGWIWSSFQMTGLWVSLLYSKLHDGMDFSLMNMWWSLQQLVDKRTNTS